MTSGTLLAETRQWLKKHNLRIHKRLGQHFLINETVFSQILEYANLSANETVLEIGTGTGFLTKALAQNVRHVYTIERDPALYKILQQEFQPHNRISLIQGDAIKIDWPEADKLVANIPYSISSPVFFKFFKTQLPIAILMLQKEFAERLTARPRTKQYGRLTLMAYYYASIELLAQVPAESFYPAPAVASALVRIHRRPHPPIDIKNIDLFAQVVTALFGQRRKKIRSPLKALLTELSLKPHQIQDIFDQLDWLDHRPEELTPEEFARIANQISEEYPP